MSKVCPKCQSKNVKKIIYGYPSNELFEKAQAGKVVLGGCCVSPDNPDYACLDCQHQWQTKADFFTFVTDLNIKNMFWGFIVGDAMGVPTEFLPREKLQAHKVTEMIADNHHFHVPKGSFSDDSSMTIATMDSIINKKTIDYADIMHNFLEWLNNAKYTPTGEVFDVGRTCLRAIAKYNRSSTEPTKCGLANFNDNGNGSLMRILPFVLYSYYKQYNEAESYQLIKKASSLTHTHEISIMGCYIYYLYLKYLLDGLTKEQAYQKLKTFPYHKYFKADTINIYQRILNDDIAKYELNEINSTGYVVDTLEAVLWGFLKGNNYQEIIITAINLGNDTDTIAAITGSLAGLYYGDIPKEWLSSLQQKKYLTTLINNFVEYITENKK